MLTCKIHVFRYPSKIHDCRKLGGKNRKIERGTVLPIISHLVTVLWFNVFTVFLCFILHS